MSSKTLILFPPFRLDAMNEQLWRDDELLSVRPKPFAVLAYLATHSGRLVTAGELRKAIWPNTYVGEGLLRGYIREVRIVLGDDPTTPRFVETVPRRGYRFLPAVISTPVQRSTSPVSSSPSPPASHGEKAEPPFSSLGTWNLQPEANLIGREDELHQLHGWFAKAVSGERQLVFVTGEPGIGKTTLIDAFLLGIGQEGTGNGQQTLSKRERATGSRPQAKPSVFSPLPDALSLAPGVWVGRGQCVEHYGSGEAYLPMLEALGRLCRRPDGEQILSLLCRYAPTWAAQMPALFDDAEFEALQRKVQGSTRERMLREMAEALEALTAARPLVVVLEDLHWSDYSTLDLLTVLAQRRGPARLFLLATYRPTDVIVSGHPLKAVMQELRVHGQCEELPLRLLTTEEVREYVTACFPQHQLPTQFANVLHHSTEGNPLFMVNVLDDWKRQGVVVDTDGQWQLTTQVEHLAASAPESVRQMIEKQVGRLTPEERRVVETASVVGGEFTTAAAAAGLGEQSEKIEAWCEGLVKREQFLQTQGTEVLADGTVTGRYRFVHALHQQVLYEGLTAVRRIQLHRRLGEWGVQAHGERIDEIATELAMHFERGQDYRQAVQYLTRAGKNALRRSAHPEAIRLLTRGLALLMTLPETPERNQLELALQCPLGATLTVTKGYAAPEVQRAHERAFELCQQKGASHALFPALAGLWAFRFLRAELQTTRELAAQLFGLAQSLADPALLLWAHTAQGIILSTLGESPAALGHLEEAIALYDPQRPRLGNTQIAAQDPRALCLSYIAWTLWRLGYPAQARKKTEEVIAFAHELAHPFSLAFALDFGGAGIHMFLRDAPAVHAYAEALVALCREQSFPYWLAWGAVRQGWVLVEQGQVAAGIAMMRHGMDAARVTGAELSMSYMLAQLAEAHGKMGQAAKGLPLLTEAFARVEQTGECWYEAELWRLKGELLLQQRTIGSRKAKVKSRKAK